MIPRRGLIVLIAVCLPPAIQSRQTSPSGVEDTGDEPPVCSIRLSLGSLVTQLVEVKPGRIVGADYNLHVEDSIVYGFVAGKTTRIKVQNGEISGSAGENDMLMKYVKAETFTEVSGLYGNGRVVARVTDNRVNVSTIRGALHLARQEGNHFAGQIGLSADIGPANLTMYGCDLPMVRERPDLIVLLFLWWIGG